MNNKFYNFLAQEIEGLKQAALFKEERIITSPQAAEITISGTHEPVINFCANNYLGLSNNAKLIEAAKQGMDHYGFGLSSVRFICGTQDIHKKLETRLAHFLGKEETILYSSCFDANGGLFETLLSAEDAVISDSLNHASLIDGIRLCKAKRYVYSNNNMHELEEKLKAAQEHRFRMVVTDGVFSMDGTIADLKTICKLAHQYNALVVVDDSHAVGFVGKQGRGTHEYCDVIDQVDILTGTLGKALGGASGGYVAGRKEVITWLRQRSRPYLFSNTVAPMIVAGSLAALDLIEHATELRTRLWENTHYFREGLNRLGFNVIPGEHPIVPVMLGEASLAKQMANALLHEGIYVIGFSYPVVPQGQARIRTQVSAGHTRAHLDKTLHAFEKVGKQLGVLSV